MKYFNTTSRVLLLTCMLVGIPTINTASAQTPIPIPYPNIDQKQVDAPENVKKVKIHKKPVKKNQPGILPGAPILINLKADQRLMLTNGDYIERQADGTVNFVSMNGRVVRPFPQGKVVKDKSGRITIISGKQRVQAGMFKRPATQPAQKGIRTVPDGTSNTISLSESTGDRERVRDHRVTETELGLRSSERLILTNGNYIEHQADGTVNLIAMNDRVVRSFPQGKIVNDGRRIFVISGKQRIEAGTYKSIEEKMINRRDHRTESANEQVIVRDHRRSETPVNLKTSERLLLTNGNYIERLADGSVHFVSMKARVGPRTFPQGKVVKDKSGEVTIISGKQRIPAGVFKRRATQFSLKGFKDVQDGTSNTVGMTESAGDQVIVRDHRTKNVYAVVRKGRPGSTQREAYCSSKLDSCVDDVDDACSAGQESHTAEQLCRASEITTCKNAYGSTSDCLTRDLSGRQSHEIERIGGNEKVGATPERDTRPTTKNLREKVLMKGPARVKNTPVTAKDCTSFGGKLQRDDSCGSSQSCITDNYKHCVTKSTK